MPRIAAPQDNLDAFDREVNRMLHSFMAHEQRRQPQVWRPATDVYETVQAVVVQVEIAGVDPQGIEISFSERILSIRGERPDPRQKVSYHRMEIPFGPFETQVLLPGSYVTDSIQAQYEGGFLMVTLPKAKPFAISVRKP